MSKTCDTFRGTLGGKWQPAALVTPDVITFKLMLALAAILRAEDYAHVGRGEDYGIIERAFPIQMWTVWSFTVGALLIVGMAWRRHVIVWLGHSLGAGLYALLAVAQIGRAFDDWPPPLGSVRQMIPTTEWTLMVVLLVVVAVAGALSAKGELRHAAACAGMLALFVAVVTVPLAEAPADGLRGTMPLAILSTVHMLLALRSGPRPLTDDNSVAIGETTVADHGADT